MFESRRPFARFAALALVLAPAALAAQGEKVSIRRMPAPNQTIKIKMTQDMNMEMTMAGVPAGAGVPPGPMRSLGKTVFEGTQKAGSPDAEGRVSVDFTFDQVTSDMTMNGRAAPSPNTSDSLKGKKFTMIFDDQGKVVDFKVPDDLAAMAPNLNEWMTSIMGRLPTVTLGVGETATVPLNLPLPVPMPGAAPMGMVGQTTFRLLSVGRDGAERIASLDQKSEAKLTSSMDMPGPNGSATMNLDFTMASSGTTQWNLDSGFVKSSDVISTIDGTMTGPIGMTIHGTIRALTEGTPIR